MFKLWGKRKGEKITGNKDFTPRKEWFLQHIIIRISLIIILIFIYFKVNLPWKNMEAFNYNELLPLVSDALLAIITALAADLFINANYNKHLKDTLYEIITDSRLIESFVDQKRKEEIMYSAMNANLGPDITAVLYGNIFDNY